MAWCLHRVCAKSPHFITLLSLSRACSQFYSKLGVDVMDEFTSRLMQNKIGKWDQKKRKNEIFLEHNLYRPEERRSDANSAENLHGEHLRLLYQNLLDNEDSEAVIRLTRSCIRHKKLPPESTLFNVLSICSQSGAKNIIHQLKELCKLHRPQTLKENSNFLDFLAEATWIKGDVSKALEMFEEVYRENAHLRRRVRLMLKFLITDLVSNGSGAALANTITFSERILRDFRDCFPMLSVWQACFLSEWFTDQTVAIELLERHSTFCKSVISRIPYVVFVSLKCHRTEVVYRLLEILLKNQMKSQYSSVLGSLLEYQFKYGDWVRCSEIITWAMENNVALPQHYHLQMINMILNQKLKTPLVVTERKPEDSTKCDFKF